MLWRWAVMNGRANALLASSDGGHTWEKLPDPPGAGPMDFTSARDGWIIGGAKNQVGIGIIETDRLWTTNDGGATWKEVNVPLPSVPNTESATPYFYNLHFKNDLEGIAVAQVQLPDTNPESIFFSCTTLDAGKTWQVSLLDAIGAIPSFTDSRVIWFIPDRGTRNVTIRTGDAAFSSSLPDFFVAGWQCTYGDFSDDSNAWVAWVTYNTNAPAVFKGGFTFSQPRPISAALGFRPAGNQVESELLSTTDGGRTYQVITPPAGAVPLGSNPALPPPQVNAVNGIQRVDPRGQPVLALVSATNPIDITGRGFLPQNTVRFGPRVMQVARQRRRALALLCSHRLLPLGTYDISVVKMPSAKSNSLQVSVQMSSVPQYPSITISPPKL